MFLDVQNVLDAAAELAVDKSFIEKDWYATQIVEVIASINDNDIAPIFSGGTCLLKAYKLIKRFSEDVDFCAQLSDVKLTRGILSKFKNKIISAFVDSMSYAQESEIINFNAALEIIQELATKILTA